MKLFTTGQFAKFCGTSKDTLIFYDRLGLLKPNHVSGNGYRRYGPEQFYDFDLISMLKETGSSLAEIKDYFVNRDPERMLLLLEEKKRFLQQESERLARRRTMLDEMSRMLGEASQISYDILSFADLDEERLELVATQTGAHIAEDDGNAFAVQYNEYVTGFGGIPQAFYGVMIDSDSLAAGRYVVSHFFHRASHVASHAASDKHLHLRPKGHYAMFCHQGDIRSHIKAYHQMLAGITESGFRIDGPMYAYDLISCLVAQKTGEYATKYCVRIKS